MQNGYYLNKTGDRVNELLSRHFIVPTLNSVPNEHTTVWQDGEYTVTFRVGEQCRVNVDGNYKLYTLIDVTNGIATWKEEIEGNVITLSEEQYEELKTQGGIMLDRIYLILEEGEPKYLYIGTILIAKKEEGSIGFAYNFPIIF